MRVASQCENVQMQVEFATDQRDKAQMLKLAEIDEIIKQE